MLSEQNSSRTACNSLRSSEVTLPLVLIRGFAIPLLITLWQDNGYVMLAYYMAIAVDLPLEEVALFKMGCPEPLLHLPQMFDMTVQVL